MAMKWKSRSTLVTTQPSNVYPEHTLTSVQEDSRVPRILIKFRSLSPLTIG